MTEKSIEFLSEEKFPQLSGIKATAIFFFEKKNEQNNTKQKRLKDSGRE